MAVKTQQKTLESSMKSWPLGILAHRTSKDDGSGCPITETKRIGNLGSINYLSQKVSQDP